MHRFLSSGIYKSQNYIKLKPLTWPTRSISATAIANMYHKNTIDNFHGGRQRRPKRVNGPKRIKGYSKEKVQFVNNQSKDGSKFDKASDSRIIKNTLSADANFNYNVTGTSLTKKDDASMVKNLKIFLSENFPDIRDDDLTEILLNPEELASIVSNNSKLTDAVKKLNMKQQRPAFFDYDPTRPVPKGFGALSSSNKKGIFTGAGGYTENRHEIDTIKEMNSTPGILGDIIFKEYAQDLENDVNTDDPCHKFTMISQRCTKLYQEVYELRNTNPFWGMSNINDTIWELRDRCTDMFFKQHFSNRIDQKYNKYFDVDVKIIGDGLLHKERGTGLRDDYKDGVDDSDLHIKCPELMSCRTVTVNEDSDHPREFFQVIFKFTVIKKYDVYNRFGKRIFSEDETNEDDGYVVTQELAEFEIPKTVYNSSTTRYRINELATLHKGALFNYNSAYTGDPTDSVGVVKNIKQAKSELNAKSYEAELIESIDKNQLKTIEGDGGDEKRQQSSLHNAVNINFPEREDLDWTLKKKAQQSDEHYDHRGSSLTTSSPGYQGYADVKRKFKLWMWMSIGKGTHISGRGKGFKKLYQARFLRGSVGDFYGLYYAQLVGRKRVGVFTKRLTGRISLPKPSSAYIAQPPNAPIGWNVETLGDWKKSEPFAQFAGRYKKEYGEKNVSAIDRKKDLGDKHYDKYGPHDQIIKNKWKRLPKEFEAVIKPKKEHPHGPIHGVDIRNFVYTSKGGKEKEGLENEKKEENDDLLKSKKLDKN